MTGLCVFMYIESFIWHQTASIPGQYTLSHINSALWRLSYEARVKLVWPCPNAVDVEFKVQLYSIDLRTGTCTCSRLHLCLKTCVLHQYSNSKLCASWIPTWLSCKNFSIIPSVSVAIVVVGQYFYPPWLTLRAYSKCNCNRLWTSLLNYICSVVPRLSTLPKNIIHELLFIHSLFGGKVWST